MEIKGTGSVVKLEKKPRKDCRKWRIVFQTDTEPITERFNGTYTQACVRRDELYAELTTYKEPTLFNDYADRWISLRVNNPGLARSTVSKYQRQVNVLKRAFTDSLLSDLTPFFVEKKLLEVWQNNGTPLSGTYMNQIYARMTNIFDSAVSDCLIDKNPMETIKPPKIDTKPRKWLDRDKLVDFLGQLLNDPLNAHTMAIRLYLLEGLRRGEACALEWYSIKPSVIIVDSNIDEFNNRKDPKTYAGYREIPMMRIIESDLKRWKEIQKVKLSAIGITQCDTTPVCASATGTHMHPQNIDRWWRQNRAKYGLEGYVLHELRHTFLTLVASKSSSTTLKNIAGWSSITMADIYVHNDKTANREAINNVDSMVSEMIDNPSDGTFVIPAVIPPVIPTTKNGAKFSFDPVVLSGSPGRIRTYNIYQL